MWGGNAAVLVLVSDQDFLAASGEVVKSGQYRRTEVLVSDTELNIPTIFDIPATTDSPTVPSATWSAHFEDLDGNKKLDWITGFILPHTVTSPTDWPTIIIANTPAGPPPFQYGISFDQAALMIQMALNSAASRFPQEMGNATLVDGRVTVDSELIDTGSRVIVTAQDGNTVGSLHIENRYDHISFDIVSSDGGDNGDIAWLLYELGDGD